MQLLLEKPEQIAFADKQVLCHLPDIDVRADILIDVLQKLGYERGDLRALTGVAVLRKGVQAEKQLTEQGRQKGGKCLLRTALGIELASVDRLVRVAVKEAGILLTDAVKMMTATPACIMGLQEKGSIAPGMDADFAIFDEDVQIHAVFAKGNMIDSV